MMTPTRFVRFLGFVGFVAFIGLVASSRATIQAQISDDQDAPAPPPIAAGAPAAAEPLVAPPSIPPQAIEPAADRPKTPEPLPAAEPPDAALIPRAPEPVGLDAAALSPEPQPIADAAPPRQEIVPGDVPAPAADPEKQAQSFVERNRKEAESQLRALNAEAAQLRARLSRVESGIRRWQALADAMDRTEESASLQDLDPLPRAKATYQGKQKSAVIQSTPEEPVARKEYIRGADGVFRPLSAQSEVDPVTRAEFVPAPPPR